MDGIHDMGGMAGFGPVDVDDAAPTHEPWEARLQVVTLLGGDGGMRHNIELVPPATYLASSYYERWLIAGEQACLRGGRLDPDQLARWQQAFADDPELRPPRVDSADGVDWLIEALTVTGLSEPVSDPRFMVGDRVRAKHMRPVGHHRCPRYVRGVVGTVERVVGADHPPAPDTATPTPPRETVYTVRYDSTDLWGDQRRDGEQPFELLIDLWDQYLEAA
jgi:nitrile hydratase